MKDLKAVKGTYYIHGIIEEGEHETQDFKFAVNDARKIARTLSAFANNKGGRLLVGVKDNGAIAGIRNEEDIYVIEQAAQLYCRPAQQLEFTTFVTDCGIVLRANIAPSAKRPVKASEPDGSWRAYYRVADENIVAHPLMVKVWQSHGQLSFNAGETSRMILEAIAASPAGLELPDIARAAGCSLKTAESTVISLVRMEAVDLELSHSAKLFVKTKK